MANTRISNLTASASNLASTDLAPVVQTAGVGPVKMTGLQLAGGLLGSTTFNGSTVTTSSPVLNLSQTWNAVGVTFTGLKFNATDTASASGSLLLDLQVGGASRFNVTKDSILSLQTINMRVNNGVQIRSGSNNVIYLVDSTNEVRFRSGANLGFSSSADGSTAVDAFFTRAAAATLQLGAADTTGTTAPTAQFLRVQSWSSSTNNNQTGADFTIQGSRGTGTGAGGSIIFQVAPAGSSGTAQNAYSTALTIDSTRLATFANGISTDTITGPSGYVLANNSTVALFNSAVCVAANGAIRFSSTGNVLNASDVFIVRDAANTLALRNGATAQTFNVYNTYTDASNYERGVVSWSASSNVLSIGTQKAGTGTARSVRLFSTNSTELILTSAGTATLDASSGITWYGNLLAGTDNTYDIGAATTTRPRNLFIAGYEQLTEMTAPAAPAANSVRIYAEDNGSGKTRLMALFATGAAQQIAIEP